MKLPSQRKHIPINGLKLFGTMLMIIDIIENEEKGRKTRAMPTEQSLLIMQNQMASLQISITNGIDALTKETNVESINSASHDIYSSMIEGVSAQLSDDYVELSRSILLLSNEEVENTIAEHEEFKRLQQKRILDVRLKLAGLANHASKLSSSTITSTSTRTVEMEKCKAPSFSGKTIEYPEF